MKTPFYPSLLLLLGLLSCTPDIYKRPVTIDQLEFSNTAGEKYEEQFQRVNGWFLQKIKGLEEEKQIFRIDTTAKKRYRKYNHTLVASLEPLEISEEPGVYYQLYLRPNSGTGKIKGGVQADMYNELKLFSPEKLFLQHKQQYYTDSIVTGPFNRLVPVQELYAPVNMAEPGIISFSVDRISFPKGFKKRQKESIIRIVNNSIVLMQQRSAGKDPKKAMVFNYYPNYSMKTGKKPSSYAVNLNVTDDPVTDKITVHISSPGYTPDKWQSTEATFNRKDFLAGHDYEANQRLGFLAPGFLSRLYYTKKKG
ncbi:hypothetical protein CLV24_103220 [Pontibacter ummariensis]|uniref:Uncharacterized protein n=1 Tax=Pontibacter ummariensis TaxID=1610492 RepID=A0A239CJD2_9BACT|nr:hypothetical protein [Pontibacter ummariensis]PRY14981.1 hypothetical protein CLV24_103220 [Pontibacter ummariensis]SNS20220.1 hypothetical protein SAMN06296052_10393 [Pontibacter ummariensis]